jgi:hypothetical protein
LHALPHLPPAHHETSKRDSSNETKTKENKKKRPTFELKPRQVNDSSQSNQGTDHLVSQNKEYGNGGAGKAWQVVLTELREGLVGSSLQGVVEVIAGGRGEPGHHAWVERVSQDAHVDLTASMPELTVWVTTVRGSPGVVKTVKHVPEQGQKARTVQPVATEPSIGPEGGVGVVIHLSTTRKK